MAKVYTVQELIEFVHNSYKLDTNAYEFCHDDMIEDVTGCEQGYIKKEYLPLLFKEHMSLFPNTMIHECIGMFQENEKNEARSGLKKLDDLFINASESVEIARRIYQSGAIEKHFDKPEELSKELDKACTGNSIEIVSYLMQASRLRYNMINYPDKKALSSVLKGRNSARAFLDKNYVASKDPVILSTFIKPMFYYDELIKERAHSPTNKNMSLVLMDYRTTATEKYVPFIYFYDQHDFKNWLYYHRDLLKQIIKNDATPMEHESVQFASDIMGIVGESDDYHDFLSLALPISCFINGNVMFFEDRDFQNKLKLYGSILNFVRRFLYSGE